LANRRLLEAKLLMGFYARKFIDILFNVYGQRLAWHGRFASIAGSSRVALGFDAWRRIFWRLSWRVRKVTYAMR
jgi:hypothetical protein